MTEFEQDVANLAFESGLTIEKWWDNYINSCTMSKSEDPMEIIE